MLNPLEPNLFRQKSAMKKSSWKQFQQYFGFRWFRCRKKMVHMFKFLHIMCSAFMFNFDGFLAMCKDPSG